MTKKMTITMILMFNIIFMNICEAKKKIIHDLKNANIAVALNFNNELEFGKDAVTIFGLKNYASTENVYDFKTLVFNKLNLIIKNLTKKEIKEIESMQLPTGDNYKKMKRRERKKFHLQEVLKYNQKLMDTGFTHVLNVSKLLFPITRSTAYEKVNIKGFGIYKTPGFQCTYIGLSAKMIDLSTNKTMNINILYPQDKSHYLCASGIDYEKHGIKFKKSFDLYTKDDLDKIIDLLKQHVAPSLIHSFHKSGLIKDQVYANELLIETTLDEYLIIEKQEANEFIINGIVYSDEQISAQLVEIAKTHDKYKILIGYKTRPKFVYGDISNVFLPALKSTKLSLFRIGQKKELIKVE